jgi:hypothetical protein
VLSSCARFGAVYPPRPPTSAGQPFTDPEPARIVSHLSLTGPGLQARLDETVPRTGEGAFTLIGQVPYRWERQGLSVAFDKGLLRLETTVSAQVTLWPATFTFPLQVKVATEPVISSEYNLRLQSLAVQVTSSDSRMQIANAVGSVLKIISEQIEQTLKDFKYDLRPLINEAYQRLSSPTSFDVGEARACAELKVLGVEASPTILADGLEKDLALIVAPQVRMPCGPAEPLRPLPQLANVSTLVPGPFTVTVPMVARYDELARSMSAVFTDGKLFFSSDYPGLYLTQPEVYESQGKIVLKVHLAGPVQKAGVELNLDGDIFLWGAPRIVDNELSFPDLEPTVETQNLLLSVVAAAGSAQLRDQARAALRLDLGERLRPVREKLSRELTFGDPRGCFQAEVAKLAVKDIVPHGTFLRAYVSLTARSNLFVPCPPGVLAAPASVDGGVPVTPAR